MKYLFWVIVCINVLFLVWFVAFKQAEQNGADRTPSLIKEPPRDADSIILLSEINASLGAAPNVSSLGNSSLVRKLLGSRCLTMGVFTKNDEASNALSYLKSIGLNGLIRKEESVNRSGYWVFLPPHSSRADARAQLKELQANGFDSFIVTKGVNRNAISLGIFKHKYEAKQHLADLEGKIRDIELGQRIRIRTKYWLDIEYHRREMVPENILNKLVSEDFSEVDIVSRDC